MPLSTARQLLGPEAIIGVTANSAEEAITAAKAGADYLGIGTVFATPTKENTKSIIGVSGLRDILQSLAASSETASVKTVCIGGINASNCQRVLYQSATPSKKLDGVAVVSAIVAAANASEAASSLRKLIASEPPFVNAGRKRLEQLPKRIELDVPTHVKAVAETNPLCHNMTNLVVQNFAANVALCVGASPIMSNNGLEASDLANLGGALVVNMGTVTPEGLSNYLQALRAYNAVGGPVILDPVGAGATQQRRDAVRQLMAGGYFDVIKGNENEIRTCAGMSGVQQRGVDSGASTATMKEKAELVKTLAARERNIVLMTGEVDLVSDGHMTLAVSNGHKYLGNITGSGCTLGTTIASFLVVNREDQKLLKVLAGMLVYEIAAERAAERADVKGPGTFVPAFLDELYRIREETKTGDTEWLTRARVESVDAEKIGAT